MIDAAAAAHRPASSLRRLRRGPESRLASIWAVTLDAERKVGVRLSTAPKGWLGALSAGATHTVIVVVTLLSGFGWLYALRGLGWPSGGPAIRDALPLLQLAGRDTQPFLRVALAWLAAGFTAGVMLSRLPRMRRAALAAALALVLLLLASQAASALTRNERLSHVLLSRGPGIGPWLEAALFAAGCALPGAFGRFGISRQLGLHPRQHGDAS